MPEKTVARPMIYITYGYRDEAKQGLCMRRAEEKDLQGIYELINNQMLAKALVKLLDKWGMPDEGHEFTKEEIYLALENTDAGELEGAGRFEIFTWIHNRLAFVGIVPDGETGEKVIACMTFPTAPEADAYGDRLAKGEINAKEEFRRLARNGASC